MSIIADSEKGGLITYLFEINRHTHGEVFSVKGLDICIQYIKKMGHEVKAVVPQFRYISEPNWNFCSD